MPHLPLKRNHIRLQFSDDRGVLDVPSGQMWPVLEAWDEVGSGSFIQIFFSQKAWEQHLVEEINETLTDTEIAPLKKNYCRLIWPDSDGRGLMDVWRGEVDGILESWVGEPIQVFRSQKQWEKYLADRAAGVLTDSDREFLRDLKIAIESGAAPRAATVPSPLVTTPKATVRPLLDDLIFLKSVGILIDDETFAEVFAFENKHRDFGPCHGCGVTTYQQHETGCRYSTILVLPNWYTTLQRRKEDRRFTVEDDEFLRELKITAV